MAPYASRSQRPLPVTDALCERVMQLPTGLGITEEGVEQVCRLVRRSVGADD